MVDIPGPDRWHSVEPDPLIDDNLLGLGRRGKSIFLRLFVTGYVFHNSLLLVVVLSVLRLLFGFRYRRLRCFQRSLSIGCVCFDYLFFNRDLFGRLGEEIDRERG